MHLHVYPPSVFSHCARLLHRLVPSLHSSTSTQAFDSPSKPAGHWHKKFSVSPGAPQSVHSDAPSSAKYPASHAVQPEAALPAGENWLAGHAVHALAPAPAYVPASHSVQSSSPGDEDQPAGHVLQPSSVGNAPARHTASTTYTPKRVIRARSASPSEDGRSVSTGKNSLETVSNLLGCRLCVVSDRNLNLGRLQELEVVGLEFKGRSGDEKRRKRTGAPDGVDGELEQVDEGVPGPVTEWLPRALGRQQALLQEDIYVAKVWVGFAAREAPIVVVALPRLLHGLSTDVGSRCALIQVRTRHPANVPCALPALAARAHKTSHRVGTRRMIITVVVALRAFVRVRACPKPISALVTLLAPGASST
eukprot:3778651-Rhodomonas_salina.3